MSERMTRLRPERMCERQRIGNGLLLPYHLGRLTTYAVLGAVAASFGQVAAFGRFPAALLTLAAGLFLAQALGVGFDRAPRFWARLMGGATRRIPRGSLSGEFLLGLALGFLPCGLLYAAIVAAAASGRALMGAAAMLAFGAGTMPILMLIGIAGHAAGRRWNDGVRAAAPVLMVLNALLLLGLAWQRVT
jgi:sulfite exporter TauE/SafE